jgi:hypothetical protein
MKMILIIAVIVVVIIVAFLFLYRPDSTRVTAGTIKDLEGNIGQMMISTEKHPFVIAIVQGTNDFVQFSGDTKSIELDFPLVTDRQKSMEEKFRSMAKSMNLEAIERRGTGGELFLDIGLKGTAAEVSIVARAFMEKFLGIDQNTRIEYRLNI